MNAAAEPASPAATMPRQRRGRPLLPVRGVCSLIDRDEDQTSKLLEGGEIAWVFDLTLDRTRARAKALRVLPAAVADYMRGQTCSLKWPEVLALVMPHDGPEVSSTEIKRALNISGEHVFNLVRRKALVPCSAWHRGRGGCARFRRQTLIGFLGKRRWP